MFESKRKNQEAKKMCSEKLHKGLKKRLLEKHRRWLEGIKVNIKETGFEDVNWILLAQDKV
jgi:hypothetical protein